MIGGVKPVTVAGSGHYIHGTAVDRAGVVVDVDADTSAPVVLFEAGRRSAGRVHGEGWY